MNGNRHICYALLYCRRMANLGKWLCKQPLVELADGLAGDCLQLISDFPDFPNAWALRGLAYETTDQRAKKAVEAFDTALRRMGAHPHTAWIYLRIGSLCGKYKSPDKMRLASDAYTYAYKLDPGCRSCYRMAIESEKASRWGWEDADKYYMECMAAADGFCCAI